MFVKDSTCAALVFLNQPKAIKKKPFQTVSPLTTCDDDQQLMNRSPFATMDGVLAAGPSVGVHY